jgi:hypothetical protein
MINRESDRQQHYNIHMYNPQINYARYTGCKYCIVDRRLGYGYFVNRINIEHNHFTGTNTDGYQHLLSNKNYITNGQNKKNKDYEQTCTICFEKSTKNMVYVNKCGHNFHYNCMKMWLAEHNNCPMCRTIV